MRFINEIRSMLFVFYMMEVVAHMVLMRFNLTGFYVVYKNFLPLLQELPYFGYLACFYIFGVENLIAGVNLCTSVQPSMSKEVLRSLISCFVYVISSMLMLFDAESDFKYIKPTKKPNDQLPKPLHPYFKYNHLHSQGMASMVCSGIHMLHFLVALSVLRFSEDTGIEYDLGNVVLHFLGSGTTSTQRPKVPPIPLASHLSINKRMCSLQSHNNPFVQFIHDK